MFNTLRQSFSMNTTAGNKQRCIGSLSPNYLNLLRDMVARITGFSVVACSYDATPLIEQTIPCPLYDASPTSTTGQLCTSANKYGLEQACARRGKFVYFCPCGLLRAAIPLLQNSQCVGGIIVGYVRCNNPPSGTPSLERLVHGTTTRFPPPGSTAPESMPAIDYGYFDYLTDVLATMTSSTAEAAGREHSLQNQSALLEAKVDQLTKDLEVKDALLLLWRTRFSLDVLIDMLNSIASMAIIENAPQTNTLCSLLAEHLRHSLESEKRFVLLQSELADIERYLTIQKIRFGDKFTYTINAPESVTQLRAPTQVLLPFVQNIVFNGLSMTQEAYTFTMSVSEDRGDVTVTLSDNAPTLPVGIAMDFDIPNRGCENAENVINSLAFAKMRLEAIFGDRQRIAVSSNGQETTCAITYSLLHIDGGR